MKNPPRDRMLKAKDVNRPPLQPRPAAASGGASVPASRPQKLSTINSKTIN